MASPTEKPGLLARAERLGRGVENWLLVLLLAAMLALGGAQILLRNFFDSGIGWADEALRLMLLWLALLGAVAASREDRHISIDILGRILPPLPKAIVAMLMAAFAAAVSLTIAWHSGVFVLEARAYEDRLLGDLPAWMFQAILPVAFFLIGYRYALLTLSRAWGLLKKGGADACS